MKAAMANAARAAPAPIARITRKPFCDGTVKEPSLLVSWARMTPATALETEVPMDRALNQGLPPGSGHGRKR
jgi:hypothetical protein